MDDNEENNPLEEASELKKELEKIDPEVKQIPDEQFNRIFKIVSVYYSKTHSGPLPTPEDLAKYDKFIPNGAERIMSMAEKQQSHRMELEKHAVTGQIKQSGRGQVFGLVIGLFGLLITFGLAYIGAEVAAGIVGGTTIVGLVSVFVIGKVLQKKDLDEKK